ncbi:MAG: hypothetical protein LWW74_07965 [Burkholderiales bacterium]|nr:hypothetical protein [Burkholderiales bacterium]
MTKHLKALLITIIVLGVILLIALSLATRSTASFAYNYSTLFYLNIALIVVMSALLLVLAYWLFQRLRHNVFGTRLLTRFALSFVLLAVIPSVLLFLISNLFISRTINSWFNLKLDSALTAGIDFGRDRLLLNRDITQDQLARLVTQHNFSTPPSASEIQATLKQNNWRTLIGMDAQGKIVWRIDEPTLRTASVTEHLPVFTPNLLQSIQHNWVQIEDEPTTQSAQTMALRRVNSSTPFKPLTTLVMPSPPVGFTHKKSCPLIFPRGSTTSKMDCVTTKPPKPRVKVCAIYTVSPWSSSYW